MKAARIREYNECLVLEDERRERAGPLGTQSRETRGPPERSELGASSQGAKERGDPSAAQPAGGLGQRCATDGQPDADLGGRTDRLAGAETAAVPRPINATGRANRLSTK
jgi:hypothetical protein